MTDMYLASDVELKILRVPLVGRPTLTFHRGVYRADREFKKMVDSGENIRVKMFIELEKEPCKRWEVNDESNKTA